MASTNIQTAIRIRPLLDSDKRAELEPLWTTNGNQIIQVDKTQIGEPYSFDHIFDGTKSNKDIYHAVVKPLVISCLDGINSTIFAYGQTASGKTFTMMGDKAVPGIVSYAVEDVFMLINANTRKRFLLRCSCLEIYNEKIKDLLDSEAKEVKIREHYSQGLHVVCKDEIIGSPEELHLLMKRGMKTRKVGCTDMNERSSRSHTIFKLVIQSHDVDSADSYTESTLNLVDLAGSERVGQMNMIKERQVEGVSINKSLTTLALVIRQLSNREQFIHYRDSKLTRLLQDSLGGNSRTLIIATITSTSSEETKSTLEFAQRAKSVKNRPVVNKITTDKDRVKEYAGKCDQYKEQIDLLQKEKQQRDKTIHDLENKISTIESFYKISNPASQLINRRHTLAFYKSAPSTIFDFNRKNLNILEEVNSEMPLSEPPFSDCDFEDDCVFSRSEFPSPIPSRRVVPETSPNFLINEFKLLDESHKELQYFSKVEMMSFKQEQDALKQENCKLKDINAQLIKDCNYISEQLFLLKDTLEARSICYNGKHLDVIQEERDDSSEERSLTFIKDFSFIYNDSLTEWNEQEKSLCDLAKANNLLLEARDQESEQTLLVLKEENERLKVKLEETEFLLSGEQSEISRLTKEIEEKSQHIEAFEQQMKQLKSSSEAEMWQLKDDLNTEREERLKVNKLLIEKVQIIQEKDEELSNVNAQIDSLQVQLADNKTELAKITELYEIADNALYHEKMEAQSAQEKYNMIKLDLEKTRAELLGKQKELDHIKELKFRTSVQEQQVMADTELSENIRISHEKDEELPNIKVDIDSLQVQLAGNKTELDRIKELYETSENALQHEKMEAQSTREKYNEIKLDLEKTRTELLNKEKELDHIAEMKTKTVLEQQVRADTELTEYTRIIHEKDDELSNIRAHIDSLQVQLADNKIELDRIKELYETSEKALHHEKMEAQSTREKYNEIKLDLEKTRAELLNKQKELDRIAEIKTKVSVSEQELRAETELTESTRIIHEKDDELSNIRAHIDSLQVQLADNKIELDRVKELYETSENALHHEKMEAQSAWEKYNEIKLDLEKTRAELLNKQKELDHIAEMKTKTLTEQQVRADTELIEYTRIIHEKDDELSNIKAHIDSLQVQLAGNKIELDKIAGLYETSEKALHHEKMEAQSAREKYNKLKLDLEKTRSKLISDQKKLAQIIQDKEQLSKQSKQIEILQQQLSNIGQDLEKITELYETTKKALINERMETETIQENYNKVKQDLERLRKDSLSKQADLATCKSQLESMKHLKTTCRNLQEEVDYLKDLLKTRSSEHRTETPVNARIKKHSIFDQRRGLSPDSIEQEPVAEDQTDQTHMLPFKKEMRNRLAKVRNELCQKTKLVDQQQLLLSKVNSLIDTYDIESKQVPIVERVSKLLDTLVRLKKSAAQLENEARNHSTDSEEGSRQSRPSSSLSSHVSEKHHQSPGHSSRQKKHEIFDQRRGLVFEFPNTHGDSGETSCDVDKLKARIKDLESTEAFLEKENEEMLHILQETREDLNEEYLKSRRLQEEVANLRLLAKGSENNIAGAKETDLPVKMDKSTQATCDLHKKYIEMKKLVCVKRQECDFLKRKLKLNPETTVFFKDSPS